MSVQVCASKWVELHSRLACAAKSLQRQRQASHGSEQATLQDQLSSVHKAMQSVASRRQEIANGLALDISVSAAGLDAAISRLQLELNSGGNIRLEEARPTDSWLASCQELVKSRLIQAGDGLGVEDVQVSGSSYWRLYQQSQPATQTSPTCKACTPAELCCAPIPCIMLTA